MVMAIYMGSLARRDLKLKFYLQPVQTKTWEHQIAAKHEHAMVLFINSKVVCNLFIAGLTLTLREYLNNSCAPAAANPNLKTFLPPLPALHHSACHPLFLPLA
jgi:hypothetical protein